MQFDRCRQSGVLVGFCMVVGSTSLGLRGRGTRGGLLSKALAKAFAFLLACGSLTATELSLGAACDTAGAREVGDTEVEKDSTRKMPTRRHLLSSGFSPAKKNDSALVLSIIELCSKSQEIKKSCDKMKLEIYYMEGKSLQKKLTDSKKSI